MQEFKLKNLNKKKKGVWIILIPGIILFILFFSFSATISNSFYNFSQPFQRTFWSLGESFSDVFLSFTDSGNLRRERDQLFEERVGFISEIASLRELREENETLRTALEFNLQEDFDLLMADVLGRDILQDIILVDRGLLDGVVVGMPVITENKIVVGRVFEVYDNFSKIALVSYTEGLFNVEIQNRQTIGVVRGQGRGKMLLDFVSKDAEISDGDIIMTAIADGIFPSGLPIGVIRNIERSDLEAFQKSDVVSFLNIRRIRKVFIIKDYPI
ncbi:MAG: rod shape-determining protein MreC [Candidatus Nealsonbacteria bacterium]|nr:rod shape-determining protein MreC [Candidatus Nealsonbacteria bacterium]